MENDQARLLVVDDDEFNRTVISRLLEKTGYSCFDLAEDGLVALEKIREKNYDCIMLDLEMPQMGGIKVLEEMQKDMRLRDVPVIVISGNKETASAIRCIELGAADYLNKPIDPVLLKARLGACIETKRLRIQQLAYIKKLQEEQQRSDQLLNVILPESAVHELKSTGRVPPRTYHNVCMLFCDIAKFTAYCDTHNAEDVVTGLQNLFVTFEKITRKHEMEKIKTIGDEFMASAGLMLANPAPLKSAIACGLDMIEAAALNDPPWKVRVGINQGQVIAGIVGHDRYQFDVWGDTVNTASRMTDIGNEGAITMPVKAWLGVQDICDARPVELVDVKGKGKLEVVEIHGLR